MYFYQPSVNDEERTKRVVLIKGRQAWKGPGGIDRFLRGFLLASVQLQSRVLDEGKELDR